MNTVTIPREEFEQMKEELEVLRDTKIYKRLLEFEQNISNKKYTEEKQEYEDKLTANLDYVCPKCKYAGQTQAPFKRKKVAGVLTLRFACEKCKEPLDVTKKMKQIKKKGKAVVEDDE